jgi:ABC-type transport system involved in multi-copper enzyme maturation permease subunit
MRHLLRAEWTKFRSVPGWRLGTAAAALMIVLFAVLTGLSGGDRDGDRTIPLGPDGRPVSDNFYFVQRGLTGDGRITVSVDSLRTTVSAEASDDGAGVPWAKAGLIIKADTRPGSRYAAIMATGRHGVRMQDNYLHDTPGRPGEAAAGAPRWLRLTRSGDTVTGEDSADGIRWHEVGTAHLAGLPATVPAGLFVASPPVVRGGGTEPSLATATFGDPALTGQWEPDTWTGTQIGAGTATFGGYPRDRSGEFARAGGGFTVTGAGDIRPAVRYDLPTDGAVGELLIGTFAALIVVVVLATMFVTTEYRYRTIGITLAASPHRGRVLVAKAVVLGGVTFLTGLLATAVAIPVGQRLAHAHGIYLFPVTPLAQLRVEVGTAVLLAVAAVLALATGAVLRRSAIAVTVMIAATVVPYLLVITPILPAAAARWLTRVTPDAALAVQQTLTPYPQVSSVYTPANGYFPLAPWAGVAVLCGYAILVLGLAVVLLRRRDV